MSSDGDDDPQSPSAFLQAPSSQQSVIVDAKPFASRSKTARTSADGTDQDSSEDERENRFVGPASTWRDYTADERGLIASLDQERASDLSVHLYNAHALKSRLYDRHTAAASKPWHNKNRRIKPDNDGTTPWYPDSNWTAWPLPAEDVPRKSEGFGKDVLIDNAAEGTFKMPIAWRAGADLDDEVQALMLRKAKERFIIRSKAHGDVTTRQPSATRSPSEIRSSPPEELPSRRSSLASEARSNASDGEIESAQLDDLTEPEFMVDDDVTRRLLGQSSRHVLAELDKLLIGLHTSRQYRTSDSTADTKPTIKPRSQKRKRRSTANETPVPLARIDSDTVEEDHERTLKRDYAKHPSGNHNRYPRDWSEVLGIASVTGWNPAVIERAAKRCSALFGERMTFRTMPETAAGKAADRLAEYVPEMIPDFDVFDDVEDELEPEAQEQPSYNIENGFKCPEESCPQRNRLYEKRFMIRQHLRRVHKYDEEALDKYDEACAPQDAKFSIEQLDMIEENHDDESSDDEQESITAVATDGYMEPVAVQLGRGTDVQNRKKRGDAK